VPVRVVKAPQPHATPLPAVVLLHATGLGKDSLAARQAQFARRGYLAVAMDCRYHGDRAQGGDGCRDAYQEALVRRAARVPASAALGCNWLLATDVSAAGRRRRAQARNHGFPTQTPLALPPPPPPP
jgi:dienelactone hydrolase